MSFFSDDVARIQQWMATAGITRLRLDGPNVSLDLGNTVEAPVLTVSAPAAGHFLTSHPLRADELAPPGAVVVAGDTIGLLRIGLLLLPVNAPGRGIVGPPRVTSGTLVGYGDALFDLHPDAAENVPC